MRNFQRDPANRLLILAFFVAAYCCALTACQLANAEQRDTDRDPWHEHTQDPMAPTPATSPTTAPATERTDGMALLQLPWEPPTWSQYDDLTTGTLRAANPATYHDLLLTMQSRLDNVGLEHTLFGIDQADGFALVTTRAPIPRQISDRSDDAADPDGLEHSLIIAVTRRSLEGSPTASADHQDTTALLGDLKQRRVGQQVKVYAFMYEYARGSTRASWILQSHPRIPLNEYLRDIDFPRS